MGWGKEGKGVNKEIGKSGKNREKRGKKGRKSGINEEKYPIKGKMKKKKRKRKG